MNLSAGLIRQPCVKAPRVASGSSRKPPPAGSHPASSAVASGLSRKPPSRLRGGEVRSQHLERIEHPGTRPDLVFLDAEEMKNADEHVGRPLRIVRKHEVTIPLE